MAIRINPIRFRRMLAVRGYTPSGFAEEAKLGTRTLAAILAGTDVQLPTLEKVAAFIESHPERPELIELLQEAEPPLQAVG